MTTEAQLARIEALLTNLSQEVFQTNTRIRATLASLMTRLDVIEFGLKSAETVPHPGLPRGVSGITGKVPDVTVLKT